MQLDPNPYFRKAITPWYDSSFSCKVLIFMMVFVFVFASAGVLVGLQTSAFRDHVWFPGFLAFLSLFLVIKLFFRLRRRSKNN